MKGLLKSDYYMTKIELTTYLKMFGFFTIFSMIMKSPIYVVTMQFVLGAMQLLNMMTVDENGRDAYYMQMPFTRRQIVMEKYVRAFVFVMPFLIWTFLVSSLITLFFRLEIRELITNCLMGITYLVISADIIIPLAIKKGVSKIRMLASILVFVPCVLMFFAVTYYTKNVSWISTDTLLIYGLVGMMVLGILFLPVSYRLSVKYYQAKEF